jgi:hypothetical protein
MKIQTLTISGGAKRSRDFQSADASFEAVVTLDEGENPKEAFVRVYRSLMGVCQAEAEAQVTEAVRIRREVEGI